MAIRYLKRYLKNGIIILTVVIFVAKYLSQNSKNSRFSGKAKQYRKKTDVKNYLVSDFVRKINRDQPRVKRISDLDASNMDSLDSALSNFVDDQENLEPVRKSKKDVIEPGMFSCFFKYVWGLVILWKCSVFYSDCFEQIWSLFYTNLITLTYKLDTNP